jgi:hypothetical protein
MFELLIKGFQKPTLLDPAFHKKFGPQQVIKFLPQRKQNCEDIGMEAHLIDLVKHRKEGNVGILKA